MNYFSHFVRILKMFVFLFQVLEQLILKKEWYNFTLLYVKGHSTTKVQSLMQMGEPSDRVTVTVRELSGKDYR